METAPCEHEQKWIKAWQKVKLFEADAKPGRKKFYAHFTYPYVNAYPHLGHFYTLMRAEVVARYKRMRGFNVLLPQGWHATGSPIVNAAQRVREREEKQLKILTDMGIPESEWLKFENPEYWIKFFVPACKQDFLDMGISIDWRREYITTSLNPSYDAFIRWQFNKLREKKYVVKGSFPVVWCPKDNHPVGDHDRVQGEGETPQEFTIIKFKLGEWYLVAATLRPETIFGVTNVWVGPEIEYAQAKVNGETWIISKPAAEKLARQGREVQIIGSVLGRALLGRMAVAPLTGRQVPILPAHFCDTERGTGVVSSVPSNAPDDWMALYDLQRDAHATEKYNLDPAMLQAIKPMPIIHSGELGELAAVAVCQRMNIKSQHEREKLEQAKKEVYKQDFYAGVMGKATGKYAGMKIEVAKEQIKAELVKQKYAEPFYELTGRVVCRCLTPSTVGMVKDQWFIAYGNPQWKKTAHAALENIKLYPDTARPQFAYTIDWLRDWACSRESGLGTRLPWDEKWLIESLSDSTIYLCFDTIAHLVQKVPKTQLNDALFDYILLGRGKKPKVKGVEQMRKEFTYWYPFDFNSSGKDLIQNHLTFALFNHTTIFPEKLWPGGYGLNGWVTVDGQKMSKSLGNFIMMRDLTTKYGADPARFTIMAGGEGMDDPNWDSRLAESMQEKLEQFAGMVERMYGKGAAAKRLIDAWMESQLHTIIRDVTAAMESTMFRTALQRAFFDLSRALKWYQKRTAGKPNKKLLMQTFEAMVLMLCPFTPFLCEELWQKMRKKGFASVAKWPIFDARKIKPKFDAGEEFLSATMEDVQAVLKLAKLEQPKRITLFVAEPWKHELVAEVAKITAKTRNVGEVLKHVTAKPALRKHGQDISRMVPRLVQQGKLIAPALKPAEEQKALRGAAAFLYEEFGAEIIVTLAEKSQAPKAKQAMPGKVGVLVE